MVDAYLAAIPDGEVQEVTADRVGLTRSRMTKIILAREREEDVRLHPKTAKRFQRVTKGLLDNDPLHRARLEGMRQAAEMMEKALEQVRALAGEVSATPPSAKAVQVGRQVAARAGEGTDPDTGQEGEPPGKKVVG